MADSFYKEDKEPLLDSRVLHVHEEVKSKSAILPKRNYSLLVFISSVLVLLSSGFAGGYFLYSQLPTPLPFTPQEPLLSRPVEQWGMYTNVSSGYSLATPVSWQSDQTLSETKDTVSFFSNNMGSTENLALPLVSVSIQATPYSETERNFSIKNQKTGYFVSNIKTVRYGNVSGYAYTPQMCGVPSCPVQEVILPFAKGEKTMYIANYSLESAVFSQMLLSLTFTKSNN